MNSIQAIFLDLDGTALLPDHSVSPTLVKMLDKARAKKIEVVVCTGRNYSSSVKSANDLKIENFMVNYNGGMITNLKNNKIISENSVPADTIEELIGFAKQHKLHLNLYHDDLLYVEAATQEAVFYKEMTNIDFHIINFNDFIGRSSTKALIVADPARSDEINLLLARKFPKVTIVNSSDTLIEVLPQGMSKAFGVEFIINQLGIDKANTMAFGDQWNDYEMLNFVGHGYLMGNAPQELKDKIPKNRHTLTNAEDGIVHILKKFLD
ncbi:pyridoxal phosphate phosphatase [Gammaproteobacteria bacterium]|nr:pyridoxal phosphate phosphatase [Gammaproteobacteria bacterium]